MGVLAFKTHWSGGSRASWTSRIGVSISRKVEGSGNWTSKFGVPLQNWTSPAGLKRSVSKRSLGWVAGSTDKAGGTAKFGV